MKNDQNIPLGGDFGKNSVMLMKTQRQQRHVNKDRRTARSCLGRRWFPSQCPGYMWRLTVAVLICHLVSVSMQMIINFFYYFAHLFWNFINYL